MAKLTIPLEGQEQNALQNLARIEKRDVRMQAALLIRQSLERLGLIEPVAIPATDECEAQSGQ